jgi:PTS system nitrogen regulatory IIA component
MDITDLLTPERVIADLRVATGRELLTELARRAIPLLQASGVTQKAVVQALAERERLGSTGVGGGIALPHARIAGLAAPVGVFARLDHPVPYDAVDGEPVDLAFLILVPAEAAGAHLKALACVSRRLREPGLADRLRRADGARALYEALAPPDRAAG